MRLRSFDASPRSASHRASEQARVADDPEVRRVYADLARDLDDLVRRQVAAGSLDPRLVR
jgi:hypothetical protein